MALSENQSHRPRAAVPWTYCNIFWASAVGPSAASLCINRHLYHIASVRAVVITPAEKRRAVLIDSLICGLFPLLCYPNL
ncbi:hypothetical protein C8R44DRAFT_819438 [Mycena epipterygia]|nr:hypothetical protein C8R44DRAFT_824484 [Mycena epipterygia]KAJ7088332.1 hypothetical protein C8R44DRAFT_819438 [Mycena epipterygia]